MSKPIKFDLMTTPLQRGTSLLEASAGTGKTYAIAGLFVRLILEADLSVDQILAVTYTDAATAELRQRIRKTLVDTLKAFSGGPMDNAFLKHLAATHADEKAEMIARLERALACFDQAAIYTIHGFCQRTLQDRAFESGVLFDVELITDQSAILREIAEDFWRKRFYDQSPISLRFALKNKLTPEQLSKFFAQCINHPFLKFHTRSPDQSVEALTQTIESLFKEISDEWKKEAKAIRAFFGSNTKWGNTPYNDDEKMAGHFERLEQCLAGPEADFKLLDVLDCFRAEEIAAKVAKKAKSPAPSHRFFDLCSQLAQVEADLLDGVRVDFVRFAQMELPRRKARRKVQSFDDLLMNVYRVLQSAAGVALAEKLRATCKAALIDEFQDTDPVQYEIFRRLFADGMAYLYLIGDPKQAIYAFRGADIFTYIQAASAAERRYTLGENWRSEAKLVEAVNTMFGRKDNPFVFKEIGFLPVVPKAAADKKRLTVDGETGAPFQIWLGKPEGKSISKGDAEERFPGIVAAEIVRLLNGKARIGDRALKPEDIAVLVPENKHAQLMQDALRAVGVPSVLHTTASLFASFEAEEFRRVLLAIAQPTNERLLKGALATELLGMDGGRLAGLNEAEAQTILERFHEYNVTWITHGFFRMFRQWMQQETIRRRLLAFSDGERRLTNLLHLGEVLHHAETEFRFGASGLLQWFGERMDPDAQTADEHQLRLERDDNAVRLITIHKSKGLQYGVVFCPFNFRNSAAPRGRTEVFFHDPNDASRLACDLNGPEHDAHEQMAGRERLAENVRLMYVAITRAVHRCCFIWGKFKDAGSSAPAWLLHQPTTPEPPDVDALDVSFKDLSPEVLRSQLDELADTSDGAIEIVDLALPATGRFSPPTTHEEKSSVREFTRPVPRDWRISSFSLLTAAQEAEEPDYDDIAPPKEEAAEAAGIFAFPRGVRAGTCLHEILQSVDFSNPGANAATIIEDKLRDHDLFSTEHANTTAGMLRNLVSTPLAATQKDFTLSRVSRLERLNELEFYFPVNKVAYPKLFDYIANLSIRGMPPIQSGRPTPDLMSGFLKGFIDVVFRLDGKFYIADWKSNWLGNRVEDYGAEAMRAEMDRHQYFLQYHLYTVALHKYLTLRLPGYDFAKHFGGVFYVFLRGLEPKRPDLGIFRDRPSAETIHRLSEILGNL